jgi:hypothetical protein
VTRTCASINAFENIAVTFRPLKSEETIMESPNEVIARSEVPITVDRPYVKGFTPRETRAKAIQT